MSILKERANLKMLESELEVSIKADELYKLQNDAKLRAIEQRVPTYEHFRNMVQTAHLKPLKASELKKMPKICWNHCYNKKDNTDEAAILRDKKSPLRSDLRSFDNLVKPQNTVEFLNVWKSITINEEKFKYLQSFRDELKSKYFKVEVPTDFIQDIIQLSLTNCFAEKVSEIIDILDILTECNRFTLSLSMISRSEMNLLFILLNEMSDKSKRTEEINKIENLRKKYFF